MGLRRCWRRARHALTFAARDARAAVPGTLRHLRGPRRALTDPNACTVVVVMRNALPWLEVFIDHYLSLGAARIVLLDNGSVDGTLEQVPRRPEITLLATGLDFGRHQQAMRRALARRWAGPGWVLQVDVDELFDYPGRSTLGLPRLLADLRAAGHGAMQALMLDLYAPGPSANWPAGGADMLARCRYFDAPQAQPVPRVRGAVARAPAGLDRMWVGGVRARVFGVTPWLVKYPLLRPGAGALPAPANNHFCTGTRVADVTGVLRHYKFLAGFADQCRSAVAHGGYAGNSREYRDYLQTLNAAPGLDLLADISRLDPGTDALLDAGLVHASPRYRARAGLPGAAVPCPHDSMA